MRKAEKTLRHTIEINEHRVETIDNMFKEQRHNPSKMPFKHVILCDMQGVPIFTEYICEGDGIIKDAVFNFLGELRKEYQSKLESAQRELENYLK